MLAGSRRQSVWFNSSMAVNAVDPGIRLSLTDLLSADREYDGVIEVARDAQMIATRGWRYST